MIRQPDQPRPSESPAGNLDRPSDSPRDAFDRLLQGLEDRLSGLSGPAHSAVERRVQESEQPATLEGLPDTVAKAARSLAEAHRNGGDTTAALEALNTQLGTESDPKQRRQQAEQVARAVGVQTNGSLNLRWNGEGLGVDFDADVNRRQGLRGNERFQSNDIISTIGAILMVLKDIMRMLRDSNPRRRMNPRAMRYTLMQHIGRRNQLAAFMRSPQFRAMDPQRQAQVASEFRQVNMRIAQQQGLMRQHGRVMSNVGPRFQRHLQQSGFPDARVRVDSNQGVMRVAGMPPGALHQMMPGMAHGSVVPITMQTAPQLMHRPSGQQQVMQNMGLQPGAQQQPEMVGEDYVYTTTYGGISGGRWRGGGSAIRVPTRLLNDRLGLETDPLDDEYTWLPIRCCEGEPPIQGHGERFSHAEVADVLGIRARHRRNGVAVLIPQELRGMGLRVDGRPV